MTRNRLQDEYFDWMCHIVDCDNCHRTLLSRLNDIEFVYILPMDGNRAEDGIDLRYRFGHECRYDDPMIASYLDDHPCSVLEMMVALSIRCEEHIMCDPDIGDRTPVWFWGMIESLGLSNMINSHFSKPYVDATIDIFLNREYDRNGEGGLFTVHDRTKDMRSIEIWYQMCLYLNEYDEEGGDI